MKILWYGNVPLQTDKVLTELKLELLSTLLLSYLSGSRSKKTVIASLTACVSKGTLHKTALVSQFCETDVLTWKVKLDWPVLKAFLLTRSHFCVLFVLFFKHPEVEFTYR